MKNATLRQLRVFTAAARHRNFGKAADELHLTQELLSHMLGVHRPGVSLAVSALEEEGLIRHKRAWIDLANRELVIGRTCECYRTLRDKFGAFVSTNQR